MTKKLLFLLLFTLAPIVSYGQVSSCDLNSDGSVNVLDFQSLVNMALGKTSCTANINGPANCNVITGQRIVNAALGQGCVVTGIHYMDLSWTHSVSTGVVNYRIYRGAVSGGPYTLVGTVGYVNNYTDPDVVAGATYYYVVTAVNNAGTESSYSNEASGTIPTP